MRNKTETETETDYFITMRSTIPPTTARAAGFSNSLSKASAAVSADSTPTITVPITGIAARATKAPDDAPAPAAPFAPAFPAPSAAAPPADRPIPEKMPMPFLL